MGAPPAPLPDLEGWVICPPSRKTALVTGASSGIGRAIAQRFADDGAGVYLTGRSRGSGRGHWPRGRRAVRRLQAADLDPVMAVIRGDGRQLDAVVANAGPWPRVPLRCHRGAVRPRLRREHQGQPADRAEVAAPARPARVGDPAGIHHHPPGRPRMGLYAASKAAVRSLGRTWAAELAPRGVRVNVITPGPIATPAIDRLAAKLGQSTPRLLRSAGLAAAAAAHGPTRGGRSAGRLPGRAGESVHHRRRALRRRRAGPGLTSREDGAVAFR